MKKLRFHHPGTRILGFAVLVAVITVMLSVKGALATPLTVQQVGKVFHHGVKGPDALEWTTRFGLFTRGGDTLLFERPLHPSVQVGPNQDHWSWLLDANGQVIGISVPPRQHVDAVNIVLRYTQRLDAPVEGLAIPLIQSLESQRLTLGGGEGVDFRPAASLGWERHIGYTTDPTITREQRRILNAHARDRGAHPHPIYFMVDEDLAELGMLKGALSLRSERNAQTALALLGAFGIFVAGLFLAFKRMERVARYEEAEAFVEKEYDGLMTG
jgi:hypothetical protein